MIYGLKAAPISREGDLVRFRFRFENNLEREYIYRVQDKS
jgi:competence protein comGF